MTLRHNPTSSCSRWAPASGRASDRSTRSRTGGWWSGPARFSTWSSTASPDAVDYQLRHALPENAYWRLQTELVGASDDLDNASADNLTALRSLGEELIAERSADLDAVIARL